MENEPKEPHKYRILYQVLPKPEGITKAEVDTREFGACDCIVVHSLIGRPGGPGPLSMATFARDGFSGEFLTAEQLFQVWAIFAHQLTEALPEGGAKEITRLVDETVRSAIVGG